MSNSVANCRGSVRLKLQVPAMLLNDGSAKAEAQAHAFGFGCEKWREQILGNIRGNPNTQVDDGKLNPAMR